MVGNTLVRLLPGTVALCQGELEHKADVAPCCRVWRHRWHHCWPESHSTETAQAYTQTDRHI